MTHLPFVKGGSILAEPGGRDKPLRPGSAGAGSRGRMEPFPCPTEPAMRRLHLLLATLVGLPLALAGWLWLTMLSPFTYDRPDHLPDIEAGPHEVFVYGTLRSEEHTSELQSRP